MKTIDLSRQALSGDELTALADEAAVLIVSRTGRRFVLEEADSFVQACIFHVFCDKTNPLSLTPCFSWGLGRKEDKNRFNGFPHTVETVETVPTSVDSPACAKRSAAGRPITQLKQGVNEGTIPLRWRVCETSGQEVAALGRSTRSMNFPAKRSKEAGAVTLEEFERRLTRHRTKR